MNTKYKFRIILLAAATIALGSCQDLTGIKTDIDNLENKVSELEQSVDELWQAYRAGKLITSVEALASAGPNGGYRITFSDGHTLVLTNGADGATGENGKDAVTPMVKIDGDGYWCVSYDSGTTYARITDNEGNPINATGADGQNGASGICVRVVIDATGCYCFELYSPDNPGDVLQTVQTPYTSDASSIMQSIVEDDNTGVIALTLADGTVLRFNLDVTYPTSIVVLTDKVVLSPGTRATFEFRINPSNARFVPVIGSEGANLELDMVGSRAAESYVTSPANYRIVAVERSVNAEGQPKAGQFTVTVEQTAEAPAEYSENVVLVLTTKDGRGEKIQLSSALVAFCSGSIPHILSMKVGNAEAVEVADGVLQLRMPYGADVAYLRPFFKTDGARVEVIDANGTTSDASVLNLSTPLTLLAISDAGLTKEYRVAVVYSNLPTLYITTPTTITNKEQWTRDCIIDVWNAGDMSTTYESVQMKGRGNTTLYYPKKPYAIKLDSKAEVLGMPKHKRWVLLANYIDVTCMRNATAFEVARRLDGLAWTPRGRFVDVVMNGQLVGNYYLCEQIKIDENRVNITEAGPEDTEGTAVTGGYIFEMDLNYDEQYKFRTELCNYPVMFKDPDEGIAEQQFEYVQNYFNTVEHLLYSESTDDTGDVFDYIDKDSFVDWWLVHELTTNWEPNQPKSCYMHKDRGGKLMAGPVWDFDWGTFAPIQQKFHISDAIWYTRLFQNEDFIARVKERWAANKASLELVTDFIDATAADIRESAEGNKAMWPVSGDPNYDGHLSYSDAVARLRQSYRQRIQSLDILINNL